MTICRLLLWYDCHLLAHHTSLTNNITGVDNDPRFGPIGKRTRIDLTHRTTIQWIEYKPVRLRPGLVLRVVGFRWVGSGQLRWRGNEEPREDHPSSNTRQYGYRFGRLLGHPLKIRDNMFPGIVYLSKFGLLRCPG